MVDWKNMADLRGQLPQRYRPFLGEKTSAVVVEKTDRTRVKTLTTVRKKCCTKKPKKVVKIDNLHERRLI